MAQVMLFFGMRMRTNTELTWNRIQVLRDWFESHINDRGWTTTLLADSQEDCILILNFLRRFDPGSGFSETQCHGLLEPEPGF